MDSPYRDMHEDWARLESFDAPTVELILALYQAHSRVDAAASRSLARYGLSVSTFNILMLLRQERAGLPLHRLGELLVVSRPNVSRLIDGMVGKGWVVREEGADRRVRLARLTSAGRRLAQRMLGPHLESMRELLAGVAPERKKLLTQALWESFQDVSLD